MENYINRILFTYSAFRGPLYNFYATWTGEDSVVSIEVQSFNPDYIEKYDLDFEKSELFLKTFYDFIENNEDKIINESEWFVDVPTCQLVISQGISDIDNYHWQTNNAPFDEQMLFDLIRIGDNKADFLKNE